jgi:GNAT superfamily N-acetyltransferase
MARGNGCTTSTVVRPRGRGPAKFNSLADVEAAHPQIRLWANENEYGIKVAMIATLPHLRGQGLANAAMADLLAYADQVVKPVVLTPGAPEGQEDMSKAKLTAWYKRLGFLPNKGRRKDFRFRDTMIRLPR